jgi:hypothetical protein
MRFVYKGLIIILVILAARYLMGNLSFDTPITMAAQSKAWVYGRSLGGIVGSNPAGTWMCFCVECCVLSGRGLCSGMSTRPEKGLPTVMLRYV